MDESFKLMIMRNIIKDQIDWYLHYAILSENIEEYAEINDLLVQLSPLNVLDRDFHFAFRKLKLLHKRRMALYKIHEGEQNEKVKLEHILMRIIDNIEHYKIIIHSACQISCSGRIQKQLGIGKYDKNPPFYCKLFKKLGICYFIKRYFRKKNSKIYCENQDLIHRDHSEYIFKRKTA